MWKPNSLKRIRVSFKKVRLHMHIIFLIDTMTRIVAESVGSALERSSSPPVRWKGHVAEADVVLTWLVVLCWCTNDIQEFVCSKCQCLLTGDL